MAVSVESPMTAKDYVKAIHVFTEKNPQPNVISIKLGPRAGKAEISTRVRLADTQTVVAICRDVGRLVLVGQGRRDRHARRLPGGLVMAARTLINVPPKAKRGEVIQIKTLISHIMETGFRHDNVGSPIPRDIITSFICTYNGEKIFEADALPGDRRQSLRHVPHGGDRERHFRAPMDWRQRLRTGSLRENHGRMNVLTAPRRCDRRYRCRFGRARRSSAEIPLDQRRSAYEDMSRDNKAMQDDDTANPGMLAVLDGEALWKAKAGGRGNPAPTATATPRPA